MRNAGTFGVWAAVIVGAISLLVYLKRRKPKPTDRQPASQQQQKTKATNQVVLAIAAEVIRAGGVQEISETSRSMLEKLCQNYSVFVFQKVSPGGPLQFPIVAGLAPERILYCTSEKGYEAFTRQLKPSVLVVADAALSTKLEKFVPKILVSSGEVTFESICATL